MQTYISSLYYFIPFQNIVYHHVKHTLDRGQIKNKILPLKCSFQFSHCELSIYVYNVYAFRGLSSSKSATTTSSFNSILNDDMWSIENFNT